MFPIRQTLRLSSGTVTLRAWPATVADAHLTDLLTLSAVLGALREAAPDLRRDDVDPQVWAAFWRLARASVEAGGELPQPLTWLDRLSVLEAMWQLNSPELEAAAPKLEALAERARQMLDRLSRGQTTPLSTSL